ncbi:helix-turn-helix transcriptional regulator [Inconstantimicrobium mannanitabidum]|uniref:Uncharacterized protein n=1 Tax=Inconstantimicrobium mannanitabidum TaxID=1604901 RepID=A0ACB5R841_9CLOT|nr:helix-turn-helix transcriptional regulator [Clostridium sp. TW13]GKX65192.1 hypothetical protein rsdtw13_04500 [Clostridium sp. TW13]
MNTLGNKLKFSRKKLKLTQEDLTCELINRSSLSKIENNILIPSIPQLKYLAQKLNLSIDYLLDDNIPITSDSFIQKNTYIEELYKNNNFLDIIDKFKPVNFITTYYIAMSYYKLDLKRDAELLLCKCEKLYNLLPESEKVCNVEYLCISLNSLRKIKVNNFSDSTNIEFLNKALSYLDLYNHYQCQIYFIINNNIGIYYLYNKKYENALSHFETLINKDLDYIFPSLMAHIYFNISTCYFAVKAYDKAIYNIYNAIFFYNFIGAKIDAGECHVNLFNYYLYKNDMNKCRQTLKEALEYHCYHKLRDRLLVLELTYLYNIDNINAILDKKKFINYSNLGPSSKSDYNFILARVNFINKNYTASMSYYNKCLGYLKEKNKLFDLSIAYSDLFTITNEEKYKLLHIKYKELHLESKYNNLSCDITGPHNSHNHDYL